MECAQPFLLLHDYPVKINKINDLSKKFLASSSGGMLRIY
jgi:hypothetical protein